MRLFLLFAILVAILFVYEASANHGQGQVLRPVYYYPVDDDFDGIQGVYEPQFNEEILATESSGCMLAGSIATILVACLL